MKSTIGLLFLGLIIRNGLADVSHLAKPGHNHYLPPPIQDLPIDQDYNGLDSHPPNGVQANGDQGYLPPYQYDDNYDHNIEISYHNDFAVQQPQGQIDDQAHGGNDDDDNEDHVDIDHQQLEPIFPSNFPIQGYYTPNGESPVNTHNAQRQGKSSRGEGHSISLVRYRHGQMPLSSPAPFTLPHTSPLPHGGYDYPRPTKSADFLYSNENSGATGDHSEPDTVDDEHDEHDHGDVSPQRGYLPPTGSRSQVSSSRGVQQDYQSSQQSGPQQDYLPPGQSSHGARQQSVPQQGYLPPAQSSHGARQQSTPEQDYLPPAQSSHGGRQESAAQQGYLPPAQSSHGARQPSTLQQDYLAPAQLSHGTRQQSAPEEAYLPPVQSDLAQLEAERGYLPPVQSSHGSHHNSEGHVQEDYLPPVQSNLAHQAPQQDYLPPGQSHQLDGRLNQGYLPPSQENQARPGSRSHAHHHHHHHHNHRQANQVLNTNTGNSLEQEYLPPAQSNHAHRSGRISPTASSPSLHQHHEHGQNYLAPVSSPSPLQLVPPPQLALQSEHPVTHLHEKGHINVPLPIPQVGYFFVPGIVSRIPSSTEAKGLRPALNIPAVVGSEQPKSRPTQRLSSPEYTRAFLLQKKKRPAEQKTSSIVITPSVQTLHEYQVQNQHLGHQQDVQETPEKLLDFGGSPKQALHTLVNYLQQSNDNRQYLPPHDQSHDHPNHADQGSHSHASGNEPSYAGRGYLPPVDNQDNHLPSEDQQEEDHQHHHQHHHRHNNEPQKQRHIYHQESIVRGYLPPDNQNQITSLKTYMKGVHPSDRYGSSHYHQPPQSEKGNPPPPVGTSPPMYNNPAAIKAYAPGMAYRTTNNVPFSTFTPATYLPPVETAPPAEDDHDNTVPIGLQLNEEAKRNLAMIMPKDNTIFPLDELLDSADNEIDLPELMEQLRGRIRTVQIINHHANTAKTFRVLETADHKGVKTIKILGRSAEDPMGDHKVIRIISQGPHPGGFHQTVKIFSDHKEVTLPTTNAYLPPPKAKETLVRVLRNSQNDLSTH